MQLNEALIRDVVAQVLSEVGQIPPLQAGQGGQQFGVFHDVDQATAAARRAFEQLSERGEARVEIHDFTIRGPELLLAGKGSINAQSWKTLAQGALNMQLVLGSKGPFGDSALALGLTGQREYEEYLLWRNPINISGTLSNPNYSALRELIFRALR